MVGRESKTALPGKVRCTPQSKRKRRVAIRKRSKTNSGPSEEDGTQIERQPNNNMRVNIKKKHEHPEKLKRLRDFCLSVEKVGVGGLISEFLDIRAKSTPPSELVKTAFDKNKDKNRYKDVFCLEESRVALHYPPGADDYIHANYVAVRDKKKRFICTQAPKANTVEDFWRMVWQEKSKAILMLCDIFECGKKKCEQYWPAAVDDVMEFGKLKVKNMKIVELENISSMTRLHVTDDSGAQLEVDHVSWRSWPDRGVPENCMACFRLLQRVKDVECITVHCSAGIGRTGTIVGLEIATAMFDHGEQVSVRDMVTAMRQQRHGSVQTDIQYMYIHRCLVGIGENKRAVSRNEVHSFVQQFEQVAKSRGAFGEKK